jgi:hypothetical protein
MQSGSHLDAKKYDRFKIVLFQNGFHFWGEHGEQGLFNRLEMQWTKSLQVNLWDGGSQSWNDHVIACLDSDGWATNHGCSALLRPLECLRPARSLRDDCGAAGLMSVLWLVEPFCLP